MVIKLKFWMNQVLRLFQLTVLSVVKRFLLLILIIHPTTLASAVMVIWIRIRKKKAILLTQLSGPLLLRTTIPVGEETSIYILQEFLPVIMTIVKFGSILI